MRYTTGVADPVGLTEIAKRLGVESKTAQQWRYRKLLPEPQYTVSGQPAWEWRKIEKWARETNRLPGSTGGV